MTIEIITNADIDRWTVCITYHENSRAYHGPFKSMVAAQEFAASSKAKNIENSAPSALEKFLESETYMSLVYGTSR